MVGSDIGTHVIVKLIMEFSSKVRARLETDSGVKNLEVTEHLFKVIDPFDVKSYIEI